jgi:hypothetical protein
VPAYYAATIEKFLAADPTAILGSLVEGNVAARFRTLEADAAESWGDELHILRECFEALLHKVPAAHSWGVLLEFEIPRRQRRIDLVLLAGDVAFAVEFKRTRADATTYWQVWDYALDLVDFHKPSHGLWVIPVVVAPQIGPWTPPNDHDGRVALPTGCTPKELSSVLERLYVACHDARKTPIALDAWNEGLYRPVPTIVEAAIAVFRGMEVREIAHSQVEAKNLVSTVDSIVRVSLEAERAGTKRICFITGVPGAGKTLAGLRAVHDDRISHLTGTTPHFMSGNGPLVAVLREALVRDRLVRQGGRRKIVERGVHPLIQNVHLMARAHWDDERAPEDRVIVFDEAQRAWNAKQNKRKFKRNISEPEMLLSIMSRHQDWAVIIALVGGGQEINDGEAGLREWGDALTKFRDWHISASEEALSGGPSVAGDTLFDGKPPRPVERVEAFHLPISTRSYRAQAVAEWSNALLNGNLADALKIAKASPFPVAFIARGFESAKGWLRSSREGTARFGLVASSSATRLRTFGIETATAFHRSYPYKYWFLNPETDTRSSYQLEVAATEFEIQGLELDLVCLCWGGDLIWTGARWQARKVLTSHWKANGTVPTTRWAPQRNREQAKFTMNAYRVLLTRARQSLLIWIPPGCPEDRTNSPAEFDAIANVLLEAGATSLDK